MSRLRFTPSLLPKPGSQHGQHMLAFHAGERTPASDAVPFLETASAAGRCGVLGDKHRVPAIRRLFSVSSRGGGCEPLGNEAIGVLQYRVESSLLEILALRSGQMEPLPESRPGEAGKHLVQRSHGWSPATCRA
jgi:hypothetical protein